MIEGIIPTKKESSNSETINLEELRKRILAEKYFAVGMCKKCLSKGTGRYIYMAEELGDETIMKAYDKAVQYKGESNLQSWIGAIAKNVVNNFFRKIQKEPNESAISIDGVDFVDTKLSPEEVLLEKEKMGFLKEALEKLNPKERKAIELSLERKEGMRTTEEIASEIGVNVSNLKSTIFRAKKKLATYIQSKKEKRNLNIDLS